MASPCVAHHSPSQEQQATTTITGGFSMSHFSSYDHGGRVGGMHHEHHDHDVGHAALESLGVTFADLPLDRPPADPSMRSQSIKAGSSYKSSLRTDNDSILDDPDNDDSDDGDGDDYSRGSGRKPRVKKPHLQGRFSGRLATKEDERRLVEECRLLGPLLGGIGKRGDKSRLTLAKIVRGIATGDVRRCCEERERQLMIAKERLKQYEQPGSAIDALRKEINALRAELDKKTRQIQQLQQAAQASTQQQQQRMRMCTTEDPRQAVLGLSTSAPADPMDGVTNRSFNMAMEMMQPQQQPQGRGFSNYAAGSPGDVLTLGGVRHSEVGQLQLQQQQQQARGGQFAAQFRNEVRLDGGGMNGGGLAGPMRYQVAGAMDSFQIQQQQQQGGFYGSGQGQGQGQGQQQSFSGYVMAANAGSRLTTQQQQLEQLAQGQLITSGSANGSGGGMRGMAFGGQVRYQSVEQGPGQGMGFQQFERGMGGGNAGGYENFNPFGNMQRQQQQAQGIQQSMGMGGGGGGGMGVGGAPYGNSGQQQELHGLPMLVGPKGSINAAQGGGGGMHEGGAPGNPSMLVMAATSGANPNSIIGHDLDHVFKYETEDGIEVLMGPSDDMAAMSNAAAVMAAQQQQQQRA